MVMTMSAAIRMSFASINGGVTLPQTQATMLCPNSRAPRRLSNKLVAGTVNREDVFGRVRRPFDFLTQFGDKVIDGAGRRKLLVPPHFVQDLLACDDLPGVLNKIP